MNRKTILTTLLALALLPTPAARAATREADAPLTRDEKREARELAVRAVTRLKETGDAERVAAEFFAEDYAEHFRQFLLRNSGPAALTPTDARVAADASAADLRRAYFALLNFWVQHDLASDYEVRLARIEGADQGLAGPSLRATLPPDFFDEEGADPLVAAMKLGFFGREEEGAEEVDERAAAARIRSVARLRSFTAGLEACVEQLRRGVGRLRAEAEARESAAGRRANPEDEGEAVKNSIYRIEAEASEKGGLGRPAGARLVRVRAWPYVVLLARRDGRLRVLSVCPDFDGD